MDGIKLPKAFPESANKENQDNKWNIHRLCGCRVKIEKEKLEDNFHCIKNQLC